MVREPTNERASERATEQRERTTLLYRKLNYKEYKRGKVDAKGWK